MLTDLQNNVVSGVVLVMIVIMATLGIWSSILVGFAIPGSFLAGILVIYTLGHTMNVVVLFSLILVVGMLVDGAIIVSELADRNIDRGLPRSAAYAAASKRMAWPIIASTFTTLAVFFPMLFWPGLIGQFMRYMPITVISCLIASLAMALIFVPVIGSLIGRKAPRVPHDEQTESEQVPAGVIQTESSVRQTPGTQAGTHTADRATGINDEIPRQISIDDMLAGQSARTRYLRALHATLLRPLLTLVAVLVFTVASYVVYAALGKGVEFFPGVEPNSSAIQVHARGDLSIHEKDRIMREVESGLIGVPEIKSVYTRTGSDNQTSADTIGTVQIEYIDWDQRRKAEEITRELRNELSGIAGIRIEFADNEGGPDGGSKPINIQLSAPTPQRLDAAVDELRALMRDLGGFVDMEDNRPLPGIEWRIEVDREQAARYGADIAAIGNAVQLVTSGIRIAGYRPDDATDELDIRVRYPREKRTLDQVTNLRVPTPSGPVPLSHFVSLEPAAKTGTIQRVGGKRVITVAADVAENRLVDTELKRLQDAIREQASDPGVTIRFTGEAEEQAETVNFLLAAFLSALFLMLIILVTQFNSLYQALLVLSAILFSTAGVLIGLLVTGQTFGIVMVGIGIIALAGIVVNNNIVLIDTYNACRLQGHDAIKAALLTGSMRVRPVCLTAITTILGLMPMVLAMNIDLINRDLSFGAPSTQWWTQLASAIAGGLAFTTLLTLFLTPCLLVLEGRSSTRASTSDRVRRLLGRLPHRAGV